MTPVLLALAAAACPYHHQGDLLVGADDPVPACLETVDGDLEVGSGDVHLRFPHLTDVTGRLALTLAGEGRASFPRLERVHGGLELELRRTGRIELPRLRHVSGPVGLDLDPAGRPRGLAALRRVDGGLWIFGGGDLAGLLPDLRGVAGTVFLRPSGPVRGLLPRLERVGGHLVASNAGHLALEGLDRLTAVDGGVYLFGGRHLALPRLERIGGALAVRASRFESLARIGAPGARIGGLLLRDNPRLSEWPAHLSVPVERVELRGNPQLGAEGIRRPGSPATPRGADRPDPAPRRPDPRSADRRDPG